MDKIVDIHDLAEEEVKLVREFVEFLRKKAKMQNKVGREKASKAFNTWPLGVKGRLTRREIYDYL